MLVAKYMYKDVSSEVELTVADLDLRKINKIEDIDGETLIEIVASKIEEKPIEIIYDIPACERVGERNMIPEASVTAFKYHFSELSLHKDKDCLLKVL